MKINEGLKAGDLEGIVSNIFTVDQFKSKMGEDKDICVLCFTVDSKQAGLDLESFAEKGYKQILDADATPDEIRALVAQSQKRSAVYDIVTNPTNVSVEVN